MTTPAPFEDLPEPLRATLTRRGFTSLSAVQKAVVGADCYGRDLRISSQTGSGKTVALGLVLGQYILDPVPTAGPVALVIAPTRELASQVSEELRWLFADVKGIRVEVVTGGTDVRGEQRMLKRGPTILVGTPGRLLDHIRTKSVKCDQVAHVALDEADRMLDMGFKDELDAIIDSLPEERRSHLVSATFPRAVQRVANRFQTNALHLQGTALGESNDDIQHAAQLVGRGQSYPALVNGLMLSPGEQVLVFVERRAGAAELAELLAEDGFAALPFSGDLSQAQRTRTLHAFRNGTIQILVSTDVAARGIDVPNISMVVHMSPPQDPDDYTHRSGRTGRAGRRGRSLMLVPLRAQHYAKRLLSGAKVDASWEPVPTPTKVHRAIIKLGRKRLHAELDSDRSPAEKTLDYAKGLLEGRDPVEVVATLLELARPALPREPFEVTAIDPNAEDEREPRRSRSGPRPGGGGRPRVFRKPKHGGGRSHRGRRPGGDGDKS